MKPTPVADPEAKAMHLRILATLTLAFVLASPPARAEDWPEFRGPGGVAHYTGTLPTTWGPATSNIAWKTPLPGAGWSSPILWKNKLYLTTAIDGKAKGTYELQAMCVDTATGKLEWAKTIFEDDGTLNETHKKNSHSSPTPITDGQRLYVHWGPWGTAALNLDGSVIWKQTIAFHPQHGNGGSPILHKNLLIFTCDGREKQSVAALDTAMGKIVWNTPRSVKPALGFSFSTPQIIEVAGKAQLVAPGPDMTAGYDPDTGKEIWRVTYVGWSLIQRPTFAHGLVFVSTGYTRQATLAIDPNGTGDVTATHIRWTEKKNAPNTPSYLAVGDELYSVTDQGKLNCHDAKTGKLYYSERIPGAYSASPIYNNGNIYLTSEEGTGIIVTAGKEFKQTYRTEMNEKTFASFVPGDGALYIRTESQLYKFK
jgi:outer membrane protein assembly factor BamB